MLKSVSPHGSFSKGSVGPTIQSHFDISAASLWRRMKRLVELGWVRNHKLAYHLTSYDDVWKDLGYDLKRTKRNTLSFPLSRFRLVNFRQQCAQHDLHINLKRQSDNVRKNLQHAGLRKDDYAAMQNCDTYELKQRLDELGEKRPVDIVRSHEESVLSEQLEKASEISEVPRCNIDITLSCKGFAKLIGLKSASSGHRIIKTLQQAKLIDVRHRIACLGIKHPLRAMPTGSQYWLEGGMIMKQLPNKLYVNLES